MNFLKLGLYDAARSKNPIVRQRALTKIAEKREKYFNVEMRPGWGQPTDILYGNKDFLARYAKCHGVSISVSESYDGSGNKYLWTVIKRRGKKVEKIFQLM